MRRKKEAHRSNKAYQTVQRNMAYHVLKIPNKVCNRKEQQRLRKIHRLKLNTTCSSIDNKQPESQGMFHIKRNLKKEQVDGERQVCSQNRISSSSNFHIW